MPSQMPDQQAMQLAATAISGSTVPPPLDYVVDGRTEYNGYVLAARRLIFKPGAQLVFTSQIVRRTSDLFIIANEIASEDNENPGTVTWVDTPAAVPPEQGWGASGSDNGGREETRGGPGDTGPVGFAGEAGYNAPNVTILVKKIATALKVELAGEAGGPGGKGGTGGTGGQGGYGHPASQSLVDCKRGAGDGAPGGQGGAGGPGGNGGAGGNGGTLNLIAGQDAVAEITRMLLVNLSGGQGGQAGEGGRGGMGGPGGPGAREALPHCRGNGGGGSNGANGSDGGPGAAGAVGNPGNFFVGSLQTADIDRVLG